MWKYWKYIRKYCRILLFHERKSRNKHKKRNHDSNLWRFEQVNISTYAPQASKTATVVGNKDHPIQLYRLEEYINNKELTLRETLQQLGDLHRSVGNEQALTAKNKGDQRGNTSIGGHKAVSSLVLCLLIVLFAKFYPPNSHVFNVYSASFNLAISFTHYPPSTIGLRNNDCCQKPLAAGNFVKHVFITHPNLSSHQSHLALYISVESSDSTTCKSTTLHISNSSSKSCQFFWAAWISNHWCCHCGQIIKSVYDKYNTNRRTTKINSSTVHVFG